MVTLPTLEDDLREAMVDEIEHELTGQADSIAHGFVQEAHDRLRTYGDRMGYNVEPIIESLGQPEVTTTDNSVTVRIGWEHEAAGFFEMGTSPHTIHGQPVLSFVWSVEDAPRWVKKEFDREGDGYRVFFGSVDVSGIPASRYVRDTLEWLRREVE